MNDFEREVIDRLGRIETKLDADYHALHGNGRPGVIDRVATIESKVALLEEDQTPTNAELDIRLKGVEDRHDNSDKHRSAFLEWLAIIAAWLAAVSAIISRNN